MKRPLPVKEVEVVGPRDGHAAERLELQVQRCPVCASDDVAVLVTSSNSWTRPATREIVHVKVRTRVRCNACQLQWRQSFQVPA